MKSFIAFAITILTVNSLFAQGIHIRENAVITPGQGKKVPQAGSIGTEPYYLPCGPYPPGGDSYSPSYVVYWDVPHWYGDSIAIGLNQDDLPCESDCKGQAPIT